MCDWDFPWCLRANSAFSAASALFRPEDFRCAGMALFELAAMASRGRYSKESGEMVQMEMLRTMTRRQTQLG